MKLRQKTLDLIDAAKSVLAEEQPMTLRQVYYRLVSAQIIKNERKQYKRLSPILVKARQQGLIPWDWIEDRLRQPKNVPMWTDLTDFIGVVRESYRKDVWETQPRYVEVWVEKDALSGIFEPITSMYGVTLVVGRGYSSWSALKDAAGRFDFHDKPGSILYFGDFDPSGEDIVRALREGLGFFGVCPSIDKVSLNSDEIEEYDLPPEPAKKSDTRSRAFIEKHGDIAVELDALPPNVLRSKIKEAIEEKMDLSALVAVQEKEVDEQEKLVSFLNTAEAGGI